MLSLLIMSFTSLSFKQIDSTYDEQGGVIDLRGLSGEMGMSCLDAYLKPIVRIDSEVIEVDKIDDS